MTTIEQLAGITSQHNEIVKRVGNGSLDPLAVKRALQDIIEGKLPQMENWYPPIWWRTPEQQLERAHQLWPDAVLPEPPKEFTPRTKSEVLLLHVPDSFDSLWDKIVAPRGYTKWQWDGLKADKRNLLISPNKSVFNNPVWLAFDPERGKGERFDYFWGQADCAASEIFSALIQFPEWSLVWFEGSSAPSLSGWHHKIGDNSSLIPFLSRFDDGRQLKLGYGPVSNRDRNWSCPSVREC